MKILVNKIKGWQKTSKCLPVMHKTVLILHKDDCFKFSPAFLEVFTDEEDKEKPYLIFFPLSDNDKAVRVEDVLEWTYIKL